MDAAEAVQKIRRLTAESVADLDLGWYMERAARKRRTRTQALLAKRRIRRP